MAIRQYIGARYVLKIYENSQNPLSADWEANTSYEPLTMVNYNSSSYISRKDVPPNIGDPVSNPTYWALSGLYNGQIANLNTRLSALESIYYVMYPTGDTTDRTSELSTALLTHKAILFAGGDFTFNGSITLPDDCLLLGVGTDSHLIYTGASRFIYAGSNTEISSLCIDGGATAAPASEGTKVGIYVDNKSEPIKIHDCNIIGFNLAGIETKNMGYTQLNSVQIENTFFRYNWVGLYCDEHGEYGVINNCVFLDNHNGSTANGGNNNFTGCTFARNHHGVIINGLNVSNAAHGVLSGCAFNHNDIGVALLNIGPGESIVGCLFYRNTTDDIEMTNCSTGINVVGNNFGEDSQSSFVGSNVTFKNNTFANAPTFPQTGSKLVGYGNSLGDGTPVSGFNSDCTPFVATILSKTYINNAYLTAAQVNAGVYVVFMGGMLYIALNLNFTSALPGDFVDICSITPPQGSFAGNPAIDCQDYDGHKFVVSIHDNGTIGIYGATTGRVRTTITIPVLIS